MYCRSACVVLVSAAIDNVGKDAGGDGGASQGRPSLVRVHRYGMRWAFACCLQRRVRWQERCDVGPIRHNGPQMLPGACEREHHHVPCL